MPKLTGKIFGRGNAVSRTGNKEGGLSTHAMNDTAGVYVSVFEKDNGETEFRIYRTSGDDGSGRRELMAVMTEAEGFFDFSDRNYHVTFEPQIKKGTMLTM